MRGSEHSRLPDLSLGTRARRQELQSFPAPRVRSDLEFNERHLRSFARRVAELRCFAAKNFQTVEKDRDSPSLTDGEGAAPS